MRMNRPRALASASLALSVLFVAGSMSRADQVAATRQVFASAYWIDLEQINGKTQSGYSKYVPLAQFWSKVSDSDSEPIGSAYGSKGAGSGEFRTYCIDLQHNLDREVFNEASIDVVSGLLTDGRPDTPFDRDLGKAGWLVNNYNAGVDDPSDAVWNVKALADLNLTQLQRAVALQGAIYVAAYGVAETNFTIKHNSSANLLTAKKVQAAVEHLVKQIGLNTAAAGFIDYPRRSTAGGGFRSQDQIFAVAAPEPSTFAIAGLAALGYAVSRFRRSRER